MLLKSILATFAKFCHHPIPETEAVPPGDGPVYEMPVPDYSFEPSAPRPWNSRITLVLDEFIDGLGVACGILVACALIDHLHALGYEFSLVGSKELFQRAYHAGTREAYAFLRGLRGLGVLCHIAWFVDYGRSPHDVVAHRLERYPSARFAGTISNNPIVEESPSSEGRVFNWRLDAHLLRVPELGIEIDLREFNRIADTDFGSAFFEAVRDYRTSQPED